MTRSIDLIKYAWHRHGPTGLIGLMIHNFVYHARRYTRRSRNATLDQFDERFGTDTSGIREIRSLDVIKLRNAKHAVRYGPSSPQIVHSLIEKLKVDLTGFAFVDFGSGKGRVLLVAAGFGFREVVGIEFSRELHEIAVQNIARFRRNLIYAGSVRSVNDDAASFRLPTSDLVCYFYNPFGPAILAQVVTRLEAHRERGYRIIVIYVDPRHREVFDQTGKFAVLDDTSDALVLTTMPH